MKRNHYRRACKTNDADELMWTLVRHHDVHLMKMCFAARAFVTVLFGRPTFHFGHFKCTKWTF